MTSTTPITIISVYEYIKPFMAPMIGAIIGATINNFLSKKQTNQTRNTAIKALRVIKKYAIKGNTFKNSCDEFNREFTLAEKRAILVALEKLGIPIHYTYANPFNIRKISFSEIEIDDFEINGMISQIKKGNCDKFFFSDVDEHFNHGMIIKSLRQIAKTYLNEILGKSFIKKENGKLTRIYPAEYLTKFTIGERNVLLTFAEQLLEVSELTFDEGGRPKEEQISSLVKDVEIGLWDRSLLWDYRAYSNMNIQKKSHEMLIDVLSAPYKN